MNRDCDWMIRKKREKSVCVHGSSVRTVIAHILSGDLLSLNESVIF